MESAGFKSTDPKQKGNDALVKARLATMESLILEIVKKTLGASSDRFKSLVKINKIEKPNSGKGSDFQYVDATLKQTGDAIPGDKKLTCNMSKTINGERGVKEKNYVGYAGEFYLPFDVGSEITIEFDPHHIPDCIYVKYGDKEFLSGFVGSSGESRTLWFGEDKKFIEQLIELNKKEPSLNKCIENELNKLGSSWDIPNTLIISDGRKVPILSSKGKQLSPNFGSKATFNVAEKSPENSQFKIKKVFGEDKLIIRVFSPLNKTQFKISVKCTSIPKEEIQA